MLIGYARVSTDGQDTALQRDALLKAGVDPRMIFEDKMSGTVRDRPRLMEALEYVKDGDVFVVWKLDRLARSMGHLIEVVERLRSRGAGFKCLTMEFIDTTTASGRLVFGIFASLAEFERELIVERTKAGLAAARQRGRIGGRKPKLSQAQADELKKRLEAGEKPAELARHYGVARSTIYSYV
jgi:DNA invertase Pin-like site-specific DNA recombinase